MSSAGGFEVQLGTNVNQGGHAGALGDPGEPRLATEGTTAGSGGCRLNGLRRGRLAALAWGLAAVFLVPAAAHADNVSVGNSNPIAVPSSDTSGVASPYPSDITLTGVSGAIQKVTVTLNDFTHTAAADVDILLVGPAGTGVVLMSDVAVGHTPINGSITFDDAAANVLPPSNPGHAIGTGSYQPVNYGPGDVFPAPAPSGAFGSSLSAFNGSLANGTWSLYVVDDEGGDVGAIAGGWALNVTTDSTAPTVRCAASPATVRSNRHKLIAVTTTVTVTDEAGGSGAAGFRLVSVTSSQPDSGLATDDVPNDIQGWATGTADTSGLLRIERYGADRVYTITYEGSDNAGNTATCKTTVTVRKAT